MCRHLWQWRAGVWLWRAGIAEYENKIFFQSYVLSADSAVNYYQFSIVRPVVQ